MAELRQPSFGAYQLLSACNSLSTNILLYRARAVRKFVEHMITLGKKGTLHCRRQVNLNFVFVPFHLNFFFQALAYIYDKELVKLLFLSAPARYGEREGGYCRIFRTMPRKGDNAKMGIIELV